jgi:hypothetical protein
MAAFLTDEWFALARQLTESLPTAPGSTMVVQHVVSGAPGGKVTFAIDLVDGQVAVLTVGKRPDAACTCTWAAADARAVLDGIVDVEVAFMQGRLKVEGEYVPWLSGLRAWRTAAETRAAMAALAAHTD